MTGWLIFIGVVAFFGWMIHEFVKECRGRTKWQLAEKAKKEKFLEEEGKKPKWVVSFVVNGETKRSKPEEPTAFWGWDEYVLRTSKREAQRLLEAFYERTYFTDSEGVTYPACNVQSARIEETK